MILRGVFWIGLVWLCASHGPDLGFGPGSACRGCEDNVRIAGDAWRQVVLQHLGVVRIELDAAIAERRGQAS